MTRVKGRVWRARPGTWVYEVTVDGVVVLTDNTGSWSVMYAACWDDVKVAARVLSAGQQLRPWADIMAEAPILLPAGYRPTTMLPLGHWTWATE